MVFRSCLASIRSKGATCSLPLPARAPCFVGSKQQKARTPSMVSDLEPRHCATRVFCIFSLPFSLDTLTCSPTDGNKCPHTVAFCPYNFALIRTTNYNFVLLLVMEQNDVFAPARDISFLSDLFVTSSRARCFPAPCCVASILYLHPLPVVSQHTGASIF